MANLPNPHSFKVGVSEFLDSLPADTHLRLYQAPSSCLAIFRLLPPNARLIVLNMLWLDLGMSNDELKMMARKKEGQRQLDSSLSALQRLHITEEGAGMVRVNSVFRQSFRHVLTGGCVLSIEFAHAHSGTHASFGAPCETPDEDPMTVAALDRYANKQWETMLHYMVGSGQSSKPDRTVLELLEFSGFMSRESSRYAITSRGFQFLLEEVNTQLWDLLLKYLELTTNRNGDMVDVLSFYFMLGSLELGRDYSTAHLTDTQLDMVDRLSALGLIYQHRGDQGRFYPTRLATTLTSSSAPLLTADAEAVSDDPTEQGFLLLETNYRVYAYTSNELQISILRLFVAMRARFGNLVMGFLTRDSVRAALDRGIEAEQIITYLSAHAHPQMRKAAAASPDKPLLPPTVVDQIRLWELEKVRTTSQLGLLYTDFKTAEDFGLVRNYAAEINGIVWEHEEDRKMFVTEEAHAAIRFVLRLPSKSDAHRTFIAERSAKRDV